MEWNAEHDLYESPSSSEDEEVCEALACTVCFSRRRSMVFMPCRHMCTCRSCYRNLGVAPMCPICRQAIETVVTHVIISWERKQSREATHIHLLWVHSCIVGTLVNAMGERSWTSSGRIKDHATSKYLWLSKMKDECGRSALARKVSAVLVLREMNGDIGELALLWKYQQWIQRKSNI